MRVCPDAKATGYGSVTGSFYLVQLYDARNGTGLLDTMQMWRINSGSPTNLTHTGSLSWKNGFSDFNDSTRRSGWLRVAMDTDQDGNVQIDGIFSTDPTFKDPSAEIISGSWTDSATNRILAGGSWGFGGFSGHLTYNDAVKYTWDNMIVTEVAPPAGTVIRIK